MPKVRVGGGGGSVSDVLDIRAEADVPVEVEGEMGAEMVEAVARTRVYQPGDVEYAGAFV